MMKENYATFIDRKPLFPGNACYPLSPGAAKANEGEEGSEP